MPAEARAVAETVISGAIATTHVVAARLATIHAFDDGVYYRDAEARLLLSHRDRLPRELERTQLV